MKRLLSVAFIAMASLVCGPAAAPPFGVTLLQLLSQPEKYHDKEVQIVGYLHLEFEGDALYLHQEDFKHGILGNSIWVDATDQMQEDKKKLNDKYVLIRGKFDARQRGHLGLFSGTLKDISRCQIWSDPKRQKRSK